MILVTGGLGFIGSHTVASLLSAGHEVVATRFRVGRIPSFLAGKKFTVETVDVTGPHAVIEAALKHKVASIVHLVVTPLGQLSPAEEEAIRKARRSKLVRMFGLECGKDGRGEAITCQYRRRRGRWADPTRQ